MRTRLTRTRFGLFDSIEDMAILSLEGPVNDASEQLCIIQGPCMSVVAS